MSLLGINSNEAPGFFEELKQAGWNILHENPGTECGEWIAMLIEQYPTEVVDALGTNPVEVEAQLCDMWDCNDYEDEATGECHSFATWAEYFVTDRSVELYDMFAEAKAKISRLEASQNKRRKISTERSKREIEAFLKELRGNYPTTIENEITHEEVAQN